MMSVSMFTVAPGLLVDQVGVPLRVLDDRHREALRRLVDDRQAGAVDAHRALDDHVAQQLWRGTKAGDDRVAVGRERLDRRHPLDDAAHDVAAETVGRPYRALQIDRVARRELSEIGAPVRLAHDVGEERVPGDLGDGEIDAVDRDRVPELGIREHLRRPDAQGARLRLHHLADLFDDPGEHTVRLPHPDTRAIEDAGRVRFNPPLACHAPKSTGRFSGRRKRIVCCHRTRSGR